MRHMRRTRFRRMAASGLLSAAMASLAGGHARARDDAAPGKPPDASVLVHVVPARTGSMADLVTAYGSATYSLDSIVTLSLQQDGRVIGIDVTPGETVSAGQTLIEFGASAETASSFLQAQTALSLAQVQRKHAAQLLAQHLATRDQLAQADKAVLDAKSSLDALRREGAGNARQSLAAPFDGLVQTVPVARGQRVQPGTPLVTVARGGGMMVTVGIEPAQLARVHPGQEVSLAPLAGGAALPGKILRLDGQLDPRTRMVDVDISLPAAGGMLAGEAARAEITVGSFQGWLVPRAAITQEGHDLAIYQLAGDHAVRVPILLKAERGDQDLVTGGLDAQRPVVTEGAYQLTDGAAVRLPPPPSGQHTAKAGL